MLQTVLGLNADRIGRAFLVAPATMGQRLVRAKAKIRDAAIPFVLPEPGALPQRSAAVLQAIYAAYTTGWDEDAAGGSGTNGLAEEALLLARLCAQLLPAEPEARGLLALLLYCQARQPARRDRQGAYVPLQEQDPRQWDRRLIAEAEAQLTLAFQAGRMGRFQLEAAIQSVHAQRARGRPVDGPALLNLYGALLTLAPSAGARVSHAAALAEVEGPLVALTTLETRAAEGAVLEDYQPYWALRAHLLGRLGRQEDARAAYGRAIALSSDPAVRAFLQDRASRLDRTPDL
jgi:RNA polymerase sigma-70 factor (ECF subfamily)